MIRKQIYIDNNQDRQVKELARKLGIAEAEVIRRAIASYFEDDRNWMFTEYAGSYLKNTTITKDGIKMKGEEE